MAGSPFYDSYFSSPKGEASYYGDSDSSGFAKAAPFIGAATSLVPLLFGGSNHGLDSAISGLKTSSADASKSAASLSSESEDVLGPVREFLKNILSGDRQATLQATGPQRRRVIDQYDTAKRSIAEDAPRGGGQAGSFAALGASEASDLATIGGQARNDALNSAGQVGTSLRSAATSEQQIASSQMNALINALMEQQQQKSQGLGALGSSLGSFLAPILFA